MSKKKILMVGPYPPTVGGITTVILSILQSNLTKKFKFIPYTTSRPTVGLQTNVYDYNIIFSIGLNYLFKSIMTTLRNIIQFPIMLLKNRPELVHIHTTDYLPFWESTLYVLISKFFLRNIVLHVHATSFEKFYSSGNEISKILIKSTFMFVNKIILLSPRQKNFFMNISNTRKLEIIQNVVDYQAFNKQIRKSVNGEKLKVLFIGGGESKRKGIYDVLKAIQIIKEKNKNISFIFVGRCYNNKIEYLCNLYNITDQVNFLGYVQETEKIQIIKKSDIFILPSYAEGLPITILEAMAAGLPIISTNVGSIPEVITNGINGYIIEPGEYHALALKIMKLASDSKLRNIMGYNNRELITKKYSLKIYENKIEKLYNEL